MGGWAGSECGGFSRAKKGSSYASVLDVPVGGGCRGSHHSSDSILARRSTSTWSTSKAATPRSLSRRQVNRCSSTPATAARPQRATPIASWPLSRTPALTQIDHLITTHWHGDHFGGMAELAGRIPIREFIDHGAERSAGSRDRRFPAEDVSAALRESQAHGRQARRQDCRGRSRLAHRGVGGRGDQDAASRRRQAESVLRELQAAGRRTRPRTRSRSAAHHLREVPGRASGRSDRGTRNSI